MTNSIDENQTTDLRYVPSNGHCSKSAHIFEDDSKIQHREHTIDTCFRCESSLNREQENATNLSSAFYSLEVNGSRSMSKNSDTVHDICCDVSCVQITRDINDSEIKGEEHCGYALQRHSYEEYNHCQSNDGNAENPECQLSNTVTDPSSSGYLPGTRSTIDDVTGVSGGRSYVDVIRRCDDLINQFQQQTHETQALRRTHARYKTLFYGQTLVNVVLVLGCLVMVTAYGVEKSEDNANYWGSKWEATKDLDVIRAEYMKISEAVNSIVTRTTSVMQLTSDGTSIFYHKNHYRIKWFGQGYYSKGSLTLSPSQDSITIATGGFYAIYCCLRFTASLNDTTELKFGYEIVHSQQSSDTYITHAHRRYTAVKGEVRHELPLQTTWYLQPGDVIYVRVQKTQRTLLTNFSGAHTLSIFELP